MTPQTTAAVTARARAKFGKDATIENSPALLAWLRELHAAHKAGREGKQRPVPTAGEDALHLQVFNAGLAETAAAKARRGGP